MDNAVLTRAASQLNLRIRRSPAPEAIDHLHIEEGLNAGAWTIGLTRAGNELGLTEREIAQLEPQILSARLTTIERKLRHAGAHDIVESIADVPPVLEEIQARLRQGEQP